ncbi:hypothetical protein BDB00DRAFT_788793 [Zychaea mexicana]|uniref:uncharacterized protein n=1 Tax=Zychaea mexicana TaxID=64656 RepID=UPI0022FE1647|nr:uncharacterized protein BDB00DRAFT_788793 [Zychaea mexicana]KAI9492348.1 hypothetical protein BDB00DRAFT_788793 [Zychaea mexicana]
MPQLQTLNLSDNQITEIPAEFPSAVPNLVQLLLFGNLLASLPDTIGSAWAQLQNLQLGSEFSGNRLTKLPLNMPPALQVLDVSHNQLKDMQSLLRLTYLVQLDASYNHLRALPKSVATTWQRIQTINISNNQIRLLPEGLVDLNNLELLNVSYNLINVFPEGLLENRQLNVMITGNPLSYPGEHGSAFTRVLAEQRHRRRSSISSSMSPSSSDGDSSGSSSNSESDDGSGDSSDSGINEIDSTTVLEGHNVNDDNNNNFLPDDESTLLINHMTSSSSRIYTPEYDEDDGHCDPGVNSLYELAFRQILQSPSDTVPPNLLPDHLSKIRDGDKQAHMCVVCKGPYLREWVSSTYCRSYRGYPSVSRKIRFCSRQCSRRHAEKARVIAERQSTMRMPPGPIDFGSFEWIAAAADAAAEQQAGEEDWF